jgi:hypothetical protein
MCSRYVSISRRGSLKERGGEYGETPLWCAWVLHTVGATNATFILFIISVYSFLPSLQNSENRLGPGYFRAGGLKGHASQHPIGRRLPCHSHIGDEDLKWWFDHAVKDSFESRFLLLIKSNFYTQRGTDKEKQPLARFYFRQSISGNVYSPISIPQSSGYVLKGKQN